MKSYDHVLNSNNRQGIVIGRFLGEKMDNELYTWIEEKLDVPIAQWLQSHQNWGNGGSIHTLPVYKEKSGVECIYVVGLGRRHKKSDLFTYIGKVLAERTSKDRLEKLTFFWMSFNDGRQEKLEEFKKIISGYYSVEQLDGTKIEPSFIFDDEEDNSNLYNRILSVEKYLSEKNSAYQRILESPNVLMSVEEMMSMFKRLPKLENVEMDFFNEHDLQSLGMGGISSSVEIEEKPRLVKLTYNPSQVKDKGTNLFLIGVGGINQKVKRIRNNKQDIQLIYPDRLGALLALFVFEQICMRDLRIPITILCPITSSSDFLEKEHIRLMNGEVLFKDSPRKELLAILSDTITFAKQEKASEIVTLASFTPQITSLLGDRYSLVMSNDEKIQLKFQRRDGDASKRSWLLPFDLSGEREPRGEIEELFKLGKWALPTPWFHVETLDTFLQKGQVNDHYSIKEETDFLVSLLLELSSETVG